MKPVDFTSQGDQIRGNLFIASKPKPLAFLFLQGWRGHQNLKGARMLSQLGFSSLTYDMRGNASSEGDLEHLSAAEYLADAVIAYDFLEEQLGQNLSIGVIGNSFGSYIGALLTKEREVAALSLKVPANYPDEKFHSAVFPQVDTAELATWRKKERSCAENMASKVLHDFRRPVQIVEADQDQVIPHQTVQNYLSAVQNKKRLEYRILKDAPHNLNNDRLRREYERLLSNWALQLITA